MNKEIKAYLEDLWGVDDVANLCPVAAAYTLENSIGKSTCDRGEEMIAEYDKEIWKEFAEYHKLGDMSLESYWKSSFYEQSMKKALKWQNSK